MEIDERSKFLAKKSRSYIHTLPRHEMSAKIMHNFEKNILIP